MTERKRTFRGRAIPEPDRSKWTAKLSSAKPADPEHTKAFARAVRNVIELWDIFVKVKPDEWPSEDEMGRLSIFAADFKETTGLKPDPGKAYQMLRLLAEKKIDALD
jgi:hypothetical protein